MTPLADVEWMALPAGAVQMMLTSAARSAAADASSALWETTGTGSGVWAVDFVITTDFGATVDADLEVVAVASIGGKDGNVSGVVVAGAEGELVATGATYVVTAAWSEK